jgi:hypothetical protein
MITPALGTYTLLSERLLKCRGFHLQGGMCPTYCMAKALLIPAAQIKHLNNM